MASGLENAIGETKDVLQPLFAKPKLSTKLLSKPPFRFIHDIIVATIKSTGFPNGFFGLEELDSSKFKDSKSAKISFLNKLIHLVNVGNGAALQVSSSKIVAGLEPLKTNVLLSTFGRLAQNEKIDRNGLVRHCLGGKGIVEFHGRKKESLDVATDTRGEVASPAPDTSPGEGSSIDRRSIMEEIEACNEDMEQTRAMVSRIVAKPKCSDKLLSKPPFRFVHDLIMAIGKANQFDLGQIFSDGEMASSNVKEKQAKIQFLEKLVNFLEANLKMSIHVKPSKIISGLEPERTGYLLQLFTVITTAKFIEPAESVDMDRQEPTKGEVGFEEPQNEESKESNETTHDSEREIGHEKENVSPNDESRAKSYDDSSPPSEVKDQSMAPEEALDTSPPGPSWTTAVTATRTNTERPATSRGGLASVIRETKDEPIAIMNVEDDSEPKGVLREEMPNSPEEKTEELSIFQKIIQEQRLMNESRDGEETKTNNLDMCVQMHDSNIDDRAHKVVLPVQMSDHNFESLADAIQCIAQSTAPLSKYTNKVCDDMKTLLKERNHWINEQEKRDVSWNGMQKHHESLGPLRSKLNSLEVGVQKQVVEIKRLEASVRKNDKILKKHGVTHAY